MMERHIRGISEECSQYLSWLGKSNQSNINWKIASLNIGSWESQQAQSKSMLELQQKNEEEIREEKAS